MLVKTKNKIITTSYTKLGTLKKKRRLLQLRARRAQKMSAEYAKINEAEKTIREAKPKSKFWGVVGGLAQQVGKAGMKCGEQVGKTKRKPRKKFIRGKGSRSLFKMGDVEYGGW